MLRRVLSSVLRLVLFAAIVGVVVAVFLPGGPLDVGGLDEPQRSPEAGDVSTETGLHAADETGTAPGRPDGSSPWGEETLVVAVENTADPSRNVTPAVADALRYWERNIGYADYPARFRVRPDAADPDVVVRYAVDIECPRHADAIGCAPIIEPTATVDSPVIVQLRYDPNHNFRQVRNTAIHEFGHVLGLGHCEEPLWVMASSCAEPMADAPDAEARPLTWRDDTIAVYVDDANVSAAERAETAAQVRHALDYLENASDDGFPADVTLVRVDDRFVADVSVTFLAEPGCPDHAVVCYVHQGRDYDGDGRIEYYTNGHVRVAPNTDVAARGWYVGRALAHQLSPEHVPPPLADANYRERRSRWWE